MQDNIPVWIYLQDDIPVCIYVQDDIQVWIYVQDGIPVWIYVQDDIPVWIYVQDELETHVNSLILFKNATMLLFCFSSLFNINFVQFCFSFNPGYKLYWNQTPSSFIQVMKFGIFWADCQHPRP